MNSVSAEIIKTIQKCDREKQQELIKLGNEMLDKWYTNQAILTAVQKQACTK